MPRSKSDRQRMLDAVNEAIAAGNSYLANEITANVMVGTTMVIIMAVMLLCLVLNEVGVFSADKHIMRIAVAAALVIELPITVINSKHVGTKPWLRLPLMIDLILVCALLSAALGHNVVLVMVFPVVVSTRYFDEKYTSKVAVWTALAFTAACVINGLAGIVNLNMAVLPEGTVITLAPGQTLREAVLAAGISKFRYIVNLYLNDFIPRCIVFLCLSVSCRYVASRGKKMIEMEAEHTKKSTRIEAELDLATRIQTSMLPCLLPAFPGHENIELRAVYHPAKEVGGDFYDYFIIDKTHVGVVIADVSGKGVGAALFMTISKTVLKNQLQLGISPADALTNSNRQLCENNDAGLFVTCWAGVYDTENGTLTFVNAGHNPPVVLKGGEDARFLSQKSGFVMAGIEDYRYTQQEMTLRAGDELFFYTGGVTEATDAENRLYGEARLLSCLEKCRDREVGDQLAFLKNDIDRFVGGTDQFDDITIMAMQIKE